MRREGKGREGKGREGGGGVTFSLSLDLKQIWRSSKFYEMFISLG